MACRAGAPAVAADRVLDRQRSRPEHGGGRVSPGALCEEHDHTADGSIERWAHSGRYAHTRPPGFAQIAAATRFLTAHMQRQEEPEDGMAYSDSTS